MGRGTHLVVMGTGDGSGATSTYAVATACTDELVRWLCHVVVVVGRCTGGWGWSNDARQWLVEVGEAGRWSWQWWLWLRMERFVC